MTGLLPATVVAGARGGEATWLLERVRTHTPPGRLTAIVPKVLGRSKKSAAPGVLSTRERLAPMGKGCGCCTVRADLLTMIRRPAASGCTDHVLQAAARADLTTLAKNSTVADDQGQILTWSPFPGIEEVP